MTGTWIHDMSTTFSYPPEKIVALRIKLTLIPTGSNSHPNPHLVGLLLVGTRVKYVCCHPYSHVPTICFTNAHTNLRVGLRVSMLLIHI